MIYNFRFDREKMDKIIAYLTNQRQLAEGWGGGKVFLPITLDDYQLKCKETYNLINTRIPTNLLRIKDFKDGDLLVTPHLPDHGKLSIHVVDGDFPACYEYIQGDEDHLNHRIKVKESIGLDGSISMYNHHLAAWYGSLPWMRLPILPIDRYEDAFLFILDKKRQRVKFLKPPV